MRRTIALSVLMIAAVILYVLMDAYRYSNGVLEDAKKREAFFMKKGIRIDSMGYVDSLVFWAVKDTILIDNFGVDETE